MKRKRGVKMIRHDSNLFETSPFKNWGCRHTLTVLGFLGFASSYSMRVNLSIAIVQMVNNTHSTRPANAECSFSNLTSAADSHRHGSFNWTPHEQGLILGSFFYGYVATQVPGGILANKYGGKYVFGVGMLITAVFSLVTPLAAELGMGYLIGVRIIQGVGEGVTNPAMHSLLASWVPPLERSRLGAFVYAGTQIGTVIALPLSGFLLSSDYGYGSVFYVFGILGIVWFVFWTAFVYDSPNTHPRINVNEKIFINSSLGGGSISHDKRIVKWRKLITSGPVLAILVAQTGHGWGLYTMLTMLPTFMDDILHFPIKQNAYLSALPYFLMWIVSIVSSVYADHLRANGVSTTVVRKGFNTIAHWIPGVLLIWASYTVCDRYVTVLLITLAISINGAAWASFQVNHIDVTPNHAAVCMGITNGVANLCGIGAPYLAGYIINEQSSIANWRVIFYIAAVVYFVDNIVYLILASGETQDWDSDDDSDRSIFHHEPHFINNSDDNEPLLTP